MLRYETQENKLSIKRERERKRMCVRVCVREKGRVNINNNATRINFEHNSSNSGECKQKCQVVGGGELRAIRV